MPEHQFSSTKTRGKIRTRVTLKRGEVISLCRCWHSEKFPLCDSSHQEYEDTRGPIIILTECEHDFVLNKKD